MHVHTKVRAHLLLFTALQCRCDAEVLLLLPQPLLLLLLLAPLLLLLPPPFRLHRLARQPLLCQPCRSGQLLDRLLALGIIGLCSTSTCSSRSSSGRRRRRQRLGIFALLLARGLLLLLLLLVRRRRTRHGCAAQLLQQGVHIIIHFARWMRCRRSRRRLRLFRLRSRLPTQLLQKRINFIDVCRPRCRLLRLALVLARHCSVQFAQEILHARSTHTGTREGREVTSLVKARSACAPLRINDSAPTSARSQMRSAAVWRGVAGQHAARSDAPRNFRPIRSRTCVRLSCARWSRLPRRLVLYTPATACRGAA